MVNRLAKHASELLALAAFLTVLLAAMGWRNSFVRAVDGPAQTAASFPPARAAAARQILEQHCVQCHGGKATKNGFDLTTREALLRGGDSGPAVVPGQAKKSRLYLRVTHADKPGMPYKQDRL